MNQKKRSIEENKLLVDENRQLMDENRLLIDENDYDIKRYSMDGRSSDSSNEKIKRRPSHLCCTIQENHDLRQENTDLRNENEKLKKKLLMLKGYVINFYGLG